MPAHGDVIEFRAIKRRDLGEWQKRRAHPSGGPSDDSAVNIPRSGLQRGAESLASIGCAQDLDPDTIRAIAAFDGDRVVGRLNIVYTDLLIDGERLQRCAVGEDFFVLDEYRDRGVGLSIMLKALKLGLPFIESGVSGPMRMILDSWKQFVLVDASPMFQVALDRPGLVQVAKWDLYQGGSSNGSWSDLRRKVSLLIRAWQQRRRLLNLGHDVSPIPPEDHAAAIENSLRALSASVQLPWRRDLLQTALAGMDPNRGAWFVKSAHGPAGPWLLTLYRQERVLGHASDGTAKRIREAHLNEIFPPLQEEAPTEALLGFALDRAASMGANVLHIHALSPAIEHACRRLGLDSRMTKSIYIATTGVDAATKARLSDPASWWCRAFNENQFEEIFVGREIGTRTASPLV